ncbi:MAG: MFS transporter [Gammaproteobacteria bacterium]|nr:MFS transporter [Gammaproteobacteria bacterium]
MQGRSLWRRQAVLGWAFYDWANSAFALSIMTSFFPVLMAGYWNDGAPSSVGTFRLGMANGISSLLVALLTPLIGTLADRGGRRKAWLLWVTGLGCAMTAALYFLAAGMWFAAALLYVGASGAFAIGNSLYDSLLVDVAAPAEYDRVSACGYALGYLGSALLFTLNVLMVLHPARFGLASADHAVRVAFVLVALWWLVFSLPLAWWVRDDAGRDAAPVALAAGFRQLADTLRSVRRHPALWRFLLAYWLYIDAVFTIIKMAVDYGLALGLPQQALIQAILLTNFVAFPAALAFGWLGTAIGTRAGIYVGLGIYLLATAAAGFLRLEWHFYALAVVIGLVQGGVQSLSRSFFARLVPAGRSGEYFGFYNMLGKFAAIIGPVLVGVVTLFSGSQRLGLVSLLLLFSAGLVLLVRVPAESAAAGG